MSVCGCVRVGVRECVDGCVRVSEYERMCDCNLQATLLDFLSAPAKDAFRVSLHTCYSCCKLQSHALSHTHTLTLHTFDRPCKLQSHTLSHTHTYLLYTPVTSVASFNHTRCHTLTHTHFTHLLHPLQVAITHTVTQSLTHTQVPSTAAVQRLRDFERIMIIISLNQ